MLNMFAGVAEPSQESYYITYHIVTPCLLSSLFRTPMFQEADSLGLYHLVSGLKMQIPPRPPFLTLTLCSFTSARLRNFL